MKTFDTGLEVGGMKIQSLTPMTKEEAEQQIRIVSNCPEIAEWEED